MKKILLLLTVSMLVIFAGCKKGANNYTPPVQQEVPIGDYGAPFSFWMGALDGEGVEAGDSSANAKFEKPYWAEIESFMMQNTQVTQADFEKYGAPAGLVNQSKYKGEYLPVTNVTAQEIVIYANALSVANERDEAYYEDAAYTIPYTIDSKNSGKKAVYWDVTKNGYRIPTEAEFVFAARGRLATDYDPNDIEKGYLVFPWGGNRPDIAKVNVKESSIGKMTPVGTYKPLGYNNSLYDIFGNVDEITWDDRKEDYGITGFTAGKAYQDPGKLNNSKANITTGTMTYHGGCYYSSFPGMRPAARGGWNGTSEHWGFRLVRNDEGLG